MFGARVVTTSILLLLVACGGRLDDAQGSANTGGAVVAGGAMSAGGAFLVSTGGSVAGGASSASTGGSVESGAPLCSSGRCVVTLASDCCPDSIAVDATYVYWPTAGAVMAIPLNGGTPTPVVSGLNFPAGVMVDATNVYWIDYGTKNTNSSDYVVMKAPLDGSAPPMTLATRQSFFDMRLAQDAANIYWTNSADFAHGTVVKVNKAGGPTTTLATDQWAPNSIAVGGTRVFWESNYRVMNVSIDGGIPTLFANHAASATAIDSANLYFIGGGSLMRAPLDGGAPVEVSSVDPGWRITTLAVDDTHAYWSYPDLYEGTIVKAPLDGGTPTILATGQYVPYAIAVDATSVYWVNNGDGRVMKVSPK